MKTTARKLKNFTAIGRSWMGRGDSRSAGIDAPQHRLQAGPDGFGDDLMALHRGVDPVGLIELADAAHAFEEEGDEGDVRFAGHLGGRRR